MLNNKQSVIVLNDIIFRSWEKKKKPYTRQELVYGFFIPETEVNNFLLNWKNTEINQVIKVIYVFRISIIWFCT